MNEGSNDIERNIQLACDAIESADAIWIGAGAGMGVDSGLPDFRGDEGFWKAYPPYRKLGLNFYDLANPEWFAKDPPRAWGFYGHRSNLYRSTNPHRGFSQLLDLLERRALDYFVFTSNVDGHFQKSGFEANRVVECHGSIGHLQCAEPCHHEIWPAAAEEIDIDESSMRAQPDLPACPSCHDIARPNILMFGDWSWLSDRTDAQTYRYRDWLREMQHCKVVGLEFGAGTAVPTVRYEAERVTDELIRVNLRESQGPRQTISLAMTALEAIESICGRLVD